jgi:hypothetical protein
MMEVICSSETSIIKRYISQHIPEDNILHSYNRENMKCYLYQINRLSLRDCCLYYFACEIFWYTGLLGGWTELAARLLQVSSSSAKIEVGPSLGPSVMHVAGRPNSREPAAPSKPLLPSHNLT